MAVDPRKAVAPFDAYAALGLDPSASADDVRSAYRRLARALHPDANPGDGAASARFREVARAHAVLIDPLERARYDALHGHRRGAAGPRPVRQGPAPSGNVTVRGPAARPSHQPREVPPPVPRPDVDEWSFLGRFVKWVAVAAVVTVLTVILMLAFASGAEPLEPMSDVPRGVPGGHGFCEVPEGWVACELVKPIEP